MSNEQFYNIFRNIKDQAFRAADKVDGHFDSLAGTIRDGWSNSSWVPSSVKPSPPPQPPPPLSGVMGCGGDGGLVDWVQSHKFLTAGIAFAGVGGVAWIVKNGRKDRGRKRKKAARSLNGARKEVVVVHGAPHEPLVRSLITDLDRKGFIVHVIVSTPEDESTVADLASSSSTTKNEASGIRPLSLDILDAPSAQSSVEKFAAHLRAPQTAFTGALPHHLRLSGVVIIPDSHFPTGPIETIPMDHWSDTFNLKLVQSLAISQLFLPLLSEYKSRLLFVTPSIPHSLSLPFHAPEVAAVSALGGVISSLRREVKPSGVKVVWIKTGNFDFSPSTANAANANEEKERAAQAVARADVLSWPAHVRAAYGRNYNAHKNPAASGNVRGSSARELHWAVFDGITARKIKEVVRVGSGSVCYDLVGRYAPEGLVCWMLGISGKPTTTMDNGSGKKKHDSGSGKGSPGGSLDGSVEWEKL